MAWICGVEEAGRGPVIGPMAMVAAWTADEEQLRRLGVKDSKQLLPQQRVLVAERLERLKATGKFGYELLLLQPKEIDAAVGSSTDNLNHLELRTSAALVNKALESIDLDRVIVDCPTKNTVKYGHDIQLLLTRRVPVVAEHKADENYPVVAAASVIAKVARDGEIAQIQKTVGLPIGSGYPADPVTQTFLKEHYADSRFSMHIRKSWQSFKNVAKDLKQQTLPSFDTLGPLKQLLQKGFTAAPTKGAYETARLEGMDAVILRFTTGKVSVQGRGKTEVETLLRELGILAK